MSLLAKAPEGRVRALLDAAMTRPSFTWLRAPEIGSTMVRGRAGGTGAPFNLGEMTVTRCALTLQTGEVGHAYIQGRRKADSEAAALVDADGRVLLAERPAGKAMAGRWEFPGGKVHEGETPEAALVRELKEELAIDTRSSCLAPVAFASHGYDDFHLLMPLFACRVWQGTPAPQEGQKLAWVRPVRMRDYPMPPADEPLVALLRDLL